MHSVTQSIQRVEIIGVFWFYEGVIYGFLVQNDPVNRIDPKGLSGTIVAPRPIIIPRPITIPRPRPYPLDPSLPYPDENNEEKSRRCQQEISDCSEVCAKAMDDPNQCNVYGGSMSKCMKGCLSYECGGNNPWGVI